MAVKEIPKETQENIDIKVIEESFFDSMRDFYGKGDLLWIGCLFSQLNDVLNIEKGMIHCHQYGDNNVKKHLAQSKIYEQYGMPQTLLHTKKLPEGFSLFMIGPHYNTNQNLEILCATPEINMRDVEEQIVIKTINSKVEKLIKGKHKNVKGIIMERPNKQINRVILYKRLEMPVKPRFLFREDLEDIQTFSQIYDNFFNYQRKRDESFKNTATKIVEEVLHRETSY